jgi:hypothetical protein
VPLLANDNTAAAQLQVFSGFSLDFRLFVTDLFLIFSTSFLVKRQMALYNMVVITSTPVEKGTLL